MVAKRSARAERAQAINQARALIVTGPDELRARFAGHRPAQLVEAIAALRPRPGDVPGYATRVALRELGRRVQFLDAQLDRLDELIVPLVTARAPGLLALHGVGPDTAALLLIAAGDHPERLRSESSWAPVRCWKAPRLRRRRASPGWWRRQRTCACCWHWCALRTMCRACGRCSVRSLTAWSCRAEDARLAGGQGCP
jgi:hypothetical protein